MFNTLYKILLFVFCVMLYASCTNIDCPLDNIVESTYNLYDAEAEEAYVLKDTLTVSVKRGVKPDSVILNRGVGISSFAIPMQNVGVADTLFFRFSNIQSQVVTDTLIVEHANVPHFESIDCPPAVFHTISSVRWTTHPFEDFPVVIDSVTVVQPLVNYNNVENIRVFLHDITN